MLRRRRRRRRTKNENIGRYLSMKEKNNYIPCMYARQEWNKTRYDETKKTRMALVSMPIELLTLLRASRK